MLNNILTITQQVIILFILILIGFITAKTKIFNDITIKKVTDFMLYFVTPAVIINSFNRELDFGMFKGFAIIFIAAIFMHFINYTLSLLLIKDKDKSQESVLRMSAVFSNCGYMSFPLQNALLGTDGVFYGTAYVAVFNIMLWTLGVKIMNKESGASFKNIIFNPGIIGTVIGLVIFFMPFDLPLVIDSSVESLANLNTPVAMIIIGYHLAGASLTLKKLNSYATVLFRLIISPLLMVVLLSICSIKGDILTVCAISASAPVAAAVTMFSTKYDADTALSASMVSISTLISILTMPVIIVLAQYL